MRKNALLLLLLSGILVLSGCVFGNADPDTCDDTGILFQDDFSGQQECGWLEYNQGGTVSGIEDEVFRISTSQPGQIWWSNPERNFDDVIITVQARQMSGPDDNAYGVICRYQSVETF
jgi:hypothetical protein